MSTTQQWRWACFAEIDFDADDHEMTDADPMGTTSDASDQDKRSNQRTNKKARQEQHDFQKNPRGFWWRLTCNE